jgi:transposase
VLFEHLNQHIYLYAKDIATYVEVNFGIKYSVSGMTVWLHTHGFSYKKPDVGYLARQIEKIKKSG